MSKRSLDTRGVCKPEMNVTGGIFSINLNCIHVSDFLELFTQWSRRVVRIRAVESSCEIHEAGWFGDDKG